MGIEGGLLKCCVEVVVGLFVFCDEVGFFEDVGKFFVFCVDFCDFVFEFVVGICFWCFVV